MAEMRGAVSLSHILEAFTKGLMALRGSLDVLKSAKDHLPAGEQKDLVEKKIEEADHSLRMANAEMGQSLGFQLCQCTWPPQLMVSVGYLEKDHVEQLKCPNCGKVVSLPGRPKPGEKVTAFDPYDVY